MKVIFECSQISDGNMSLKWGKEEDVLLNRKQWLKKFEVKLEDCVTASLESGINVVVVDTSHKGVMVENLDAMITSEKNLPLFMCVADCFPVVVCDEKNQIIGLVHLGYRGIINDLMIRVIGKFRELGSEVENLIIMIGPGIKKETYVFDKEKIVERQLNHKDWEQFLVARADGKVGIDLLGYLLDQIKRFGISKVQVSDIDTIVDKRYFSHYRSRETGEIEGRFAVMAVMS